MQSSLGWPATSGKMPTRTPSSVGVASFIPISKEAAPKRTFKRQASWSTGGGTSISSRCMAVAGTWYSHFCLKTGHRAKFVGNQATWRPKLRDLTVAQVRSIDTTRVPSPEGHFACAYHGFRSAEDWRHSATQSVRKSCRWTAILPAPPFKRCSTTGSFLALERSIAVR